MAHASQQPRAGTAPRIEGLLETSLYARDVQRTAAFYRDLLGLEPLVETPRLVAFDIASRGVLLVFQAGKTEADVKSDGGPSPVPFVISFIALLVMAWVLGGIIHHPGPGEVTLRHGAATGALLWLGFVATTLFLFVLTVAASTLTYLYVERPALRRKVARRPPLPETATVAPVQIRAS